MKREITNKEYDSMVKQASPNSKLLKDMCLSFVVGGIICVIGQLINDGFKNALLNAIFLRSPVRQ